MEQQKRYPLIDIFKLFCALLVVYIHVFEVHSGHSLGVMFNTCIARQAVPFFFIASGFFFAKKVYKTDNVIKLAAATIKPILLVYFAWTVISLPGLLKYYIGSTPGESVLKTAALLFRRIFVASFAPYWYLLVLCEAILLTAVSIKFKKEKLLYIIALLGLIWGIIYGYRPDVPIIKQLNDLNYFVFSWDCNVIMKGIPYVTVGLLFEKYYKKLMPLPVSVSLYIFSTLAAIGVYYLYPSDSAPFAALQAISLFAIALYPINIKNGVCSFCRNISSGIFVLHTVVLYNITDRLIAIDGPIWSRYLLTFAITTMVCVIVSKINIKPLKRLFMMK